MIFLADECSDKAIVEHLREDIHTVWFIREMERGVSDNTVLELAKKKRLFS